MSQFSRVHVLLIDDDPVDVMAIERAFRKANISNALTVAQNGLEALTILRGRHGQPALPRPYVILLDIDMPRMNGLQFLQELRRDPEHRDAVVLMLTASNQDRDREAAYRHHVAGYLLKSGIADEFLGLARMFGTYWSPVAR